MPDRHQARTDTDRVVQWFREHPGSSVMDVRFGTFISNVTARMSDAREAGVEFKKWRDDKGTYRYRIVDTDPVQVALFFAETA
jgi:hypothetical protein